VESILSTVPDAEPELILNYDFKKVAGPLAYALQIARTGPIQIGSSVRFGNRYKALQEAHPFPLLVLGIKRFSTDDEAQTYEKMLHWCLRDFRIRGEWFSAETAPQLIPLVDPMPVNLRARGIEATRWTRYVSPPPLVYTKLPRRRRTSYRPCSAVS